MRGAKTFVAAMLACALAAAALADSTEPFFADLDGKTVHASDHRGAVVLLKFWATWCAPCRTEMPVFVRLHDELGPRGLRIVAAAADGPGDAERVKRVMGQLGMRFDVWLWANAGDMRFYGVGPGIPATLLIDRSGVVRARFQGVVVESQVRPRLEQLLDEKPPG